MNVKPDDTPAGDIAPHLAQLHAFRERQRSGITETLIDLVAHRGYAGATVSDLVREAKMSRKTFYKYFNSFDAALVHAQKVVISEMGDFSAPGTGSGLDRFIGGLRRTGTYAVDHPDRMAFLSFFDFAFKEHELDANERVAYESFTVGLLERTLRVFTQGQQDGSIDPSLPAREITVTSTNAVFGLVQRAVNIPAIADESGLIRRMLEAELSAWRNILAAPQP